jgi:hypothetical protein
MTLKNDLLIDKRIVHRNIEQGKLDTADYQKMLDALPDLNDKVWRRSEAASAAPSTGVKKAVVAVPVARPLDHVQASSTLGQADEGLDDDDDQDELEPLEATAANPGVAQGAGDDLDEDADDDVDDDDEDDEEDDGDEDADAEENVEENV